ncbi:MAG: hypothetical protein PVG93_05830 [Phycisphaerales bacterium]|jgi:hypothetical protein
MTNPDRDKFKEYWSRTEVIREYQRTLYTFGDMELPYIFTAEHNLFKDRAVVRKGVVFINKPQIVLPGYKQGPDFTEGFEHAEIPPEAAYILRLMHLPYSRVTNRPMAEEKIEYGNLQSIIDRLSQQMDQQEDSDTGLIKGDMEGTSISLMRYTLTLIVKSAPENVREFFEHIRRRRGEPIRPDERVTDEDIRRLFE